MNGLFVQALRSRRLSPIVVLSLVALGPGLVRAQSISLRGATSAAGGGGTLAISKPANVISGDVLVAGISFRDGSTISVTPPAGWTLVRRTDQAAEIGLAVYYKVAGASEPASYAWTASPAASMAGGIQAYSGVDSTTPVHVEAGQATPSGTTHPTPSVNTTVTNTMIVTTHAARRGGGTWTPPTGMTERYDIRTGPVAIEGNDVPQATAGSSGAQTATLSNDGVGVTHILALKPPAPNFTLAKTVNPVGTQLPGTELTYTVTITNTGSADAVTVVVVDSLPAQVDFKVGSVVNNFPTGISVAVEYSEDLGSTWTYVPASGACGATAGYDRCLNRIRWRLLNNLSSTIPDNVGSVEFVAAVR
jgi:uncharacterized repeat protein (TIGR01451 family)